MTAFGWIYNISIIYRDYGQFYFLFVFLMKELENLLNSLIQRGRNPKDREVVSIALDPEFTKSGWKTVFYCSCKDWFWFYADLRWIVSLESGLWQFVCRNKLYKQPNEKFRESVSKVWLNTWWFAHNYQYRLLESALIPEEELAKFLLDNIVVEWLKSEQSKK